jgi:enoyl-CoA hydratase/carnithine racemase
MTQLAEYARTFRHLEIHRERGILTVRLHSDGGPHVHTGLAHREVPEAFARIAEDPENEVVILTGTGDRFMTEIDFSTVADNTNPRNWYAILTEARRAMLNLLEIQVPVIAAVNGPVHIHSEWPLLADLVIASDHAYFMDEVHAREGIVPADGVQVVWESLIGPIRSRYFLLTAQKIAARQALELGVVNEVVPFERLMPRALELAEQLLELPSLTRRYNRLMMTRRMKLAINDRVPFEMALEGATLTDKRLNPA